jgi:formate dehydrogenase accessory protein FdhD
MRASVMIFGGVDILHRRGVMHGERQEHTRVPDPWPRPDEWSVPEDVLLDILREAWQVFRNDRMIEGSVHAALATNAGIEVVAFDITPQNAVAKVLGWCLRSGTLPSHEILVVNGLVTQVMVDAAARLGVRIIATPNVPTANALKLARISGMGIVGYMRNEVVGLFGNPGLVTFDDSHPVNT